MTVDPPFPPILTDDDLPAGHGEIQAMIDAAIANLLSSVDLVQIFENGLLA